MPGLLTYMPHLLGRPKALTPALQVSRGRRDVTVVMGVPTVRREVQNYLASTLKSLVDCMSKAERKETLIVVFIAEVRRTGTGGGRDRAQNREQRSGAR